MSKDDITMLGNNCGNCKRGSLPLSNPKCKTCQEVEAEKKIKFSQWEAK